MTYWTVYVGAMYGCRLWISD